MSDRLLSAERALSRWDLGAHEITEIDGGLINWTFRVDAPPETFVLQRVAPIFADEVTEDVARVTTHLAARGVPTPRVVPSRDGRVWERVEGEVWRVLTFIDGGTRPRAQSPADTREAGRALGRFHAALVDYDAPFAARRLGVHDTARHRQRLEAVLSSHRAHPRFAEVAPIATQILDHPLPDLLETPERVVHGDPKIANLIVDPESGRARAWIDLDTVAPMPLPLELGDALRSWCNPAGEDELDATLDLDRLEAAVAGYLESASFATPEEVGMFVRATERIAVELASRFARDALEESYFGWSPQKHPTASHHNLHRARAQLALARAIAARRAEAEARVERALAARARATPSSP